MKYMKYLLVLALAMFATADHANAQATIQVLGGGSSALFLELGQAAFNGAGVGACLWTNSGDPTIFAQDARPATAATDGGKIWIVWTPGGGSCDVPSGPWNIWSYMSLDSTVGDRCYFENDGSGTPGCTQQISIAAHTAGANLLGAGFPDTGTGISPAVISAINGKHFFVAGTDILPLDAKFATYRMLQPCGTPIFRQAFDQQLRQVSGLGYGPGPVGTDIQSFYSAPTFHVLDFNVTGNDPIKTTQPVPAYTVVTVGAQPIIIGVGPNVDGSTHNGLNLATDMPGFVLMNFYDGVLGRASDLAGGAANWGVTTLVREPLSGTYNVFEWSAINNSQFHDSQDAFNCSGTGVLSNPMNLQSLNGHPANGSGQNSFRRRVIGTGEMTKQLNLATTSDDRLGYFFWSAGNASGKTNIKYLTYNGVDPLLDSYTNGALPGSGAVGDPGLGAVTFKALNNGDYAIWSALRLVTRAPFTTAVNNLVTALQALNSTQHDMVTLANLKVWHSHYYMPVIGSNTAANGSTINPGTPGDLCSGGLAEDGGDAGGATILKQANADFCTDFSNTTGLINKTN
jgi:hypothetical protein